VRFVLPPAGALLPNSDVDPLPYYYRPVIGRLFAARLEAGLALLPRRVPRLLEIGYGSGLLMPTLARLADELYGLDLAPPPPGLPEALARLGARPKELAEGDVRRLPFADGFFDGVVAFSIFEHLAPADLPQALGECARVLAPGGQLLVGCPAVHAPMNAAFAAIGFSAIDHHHLSSVGDVVRAAAARFDEVGRRTMPRAFGRLPLGWAPYTAVLLRRR
jgi:SAM-dependent methyltransferase